ncbi:MAG: hydroxymethylglutaryl-CoA reductase, degradative [Anaerolineae bacterium]|nr:hydroxymethylglutaryl-CoA reductase, degradative [Anaerolineae bacterium]
MAYSSRIPGFYKHSIEERLAIVAEKVSLTSEACEVLQGGGLSLRIADHMIENAVGVYGLPLGIATNFLINGRDVLIPMVIEEPSVVAGASFAAKLARAGGGFKAVSTASEMIGQIQVLDVPNLHQARFELLAHAEELLALANRCDPVLVGLGGGARALEVRLIEQSPVGGMLVVHVIYDTRDAMGANAVNTMCEALAPRVEEITGGRVVLRILSNLADRRLVRVQCTVPAEALTFTADGHLYPGRQVVRRIVEASALAMVDPYRAATHNKGIMNGVDAVVIATGNDWRAVEAGAHAYAARTGYYTALSRWEETPTGDLVGTLEMPMAVGIVGGTARSHPTAQVALKILGVSSARELAEIIAAVGLAQNLAALRALATEGIQRGHMRLHARQQLLAKEEG